jgi:hypothetical protein
LKDYSCVEKANGEIEYGEDGEKMRVKAVRPYTVGYKGRAVGMRTRNGERPCATLLLEGLMETGAAQLSFTVLPSPTLTNFSRVSR